jgi:hypothetical protein
MYYYFKASVGNFQIKQQSSSERWGLYLGDELLGTYHSPQAAADDVFMQATGDYSWDTIRPTVRHPQDLSEWIVQQ